MWSVLLALALAAQASSSVVEIEAGGQTRRALLYTPPSGARGAPLVLMLHGRFGSGVQIRDASGFDAVADKHGFVVAYPDGIDGAWTDLRQLSRTMPPRPSSEFDARDEAFLLQLIDSLQAKLGIDAQRVMVAGHSNGAMMALTLACRYGERIVAVAAVAGTVPVSDCRIARPVAALFFHGTKDELVPFLGGGVGPRGARGQVRSSDESAALFAEAAGCSMPSEPIVEKVEPTVPERGRITTVRHKHRSCVVPVVRYVIEGGGHGWPGRPPRMRNNARGIDASAVIGAFFADAVLSQQTQQRQSPAP
jgi:polyhydroxybutyrate depolymerase